MNNQGQPPALSVEEAAARLDATEAALRDAQAAHAHALQVFADAEGQHAEGRDLARLAMKGNPVAMRRLDEQVRALHPGIVGYLPVPDANTSPREFYADMKDLGLRIDFPAEPDEEFLTGLADAMRTFVHRYEPKINSPKARSGQQGFAYAETRAGTLRYGVKRTRPASLVHLRDDESPRLPDSVPQGVRDALTTTQPDEHYRTLEEALTALPPLVFLAVLGGRRHLAFPSA